MEVHTRVHKVLRNFRLPIHKRLWRAEDCYGECAAEALKIPVDKADEMFAELSVEKVAHLPFGSKMDDIREFVSTPTAS